MEIVVCLLVSFGGCKSQGGESLNGFAAPLHPGAAMFGKRGDKTSGKASREQNSCIPH